MLITKFEVIFLILLSVFSHPLQAQNEMVPPGNKMPPTVTSAPALQATATPTPLAPESPPQSGSTTAATMPTTPAPSLKKFEIQQHILKFDPEKNGVKILPPLLSYSVDEQDNDIMISGVPIGDETFRITVAPLKSLGKSGNLPMEPNSIVLFFTAPKALGSKGQIEVLSEDGKTLFTKEIQEEDLVQARTLVTVLGANFWKGILPENQINLLFSVEDHKETLTDSTRKSGFRFCWSNKDENYFSRFCSPYYRYSKKENGLKVQTQTSNTKVYVDQKDAKTTDSIPVEINKKKHFLATSIKGYSVEFSSLVLPLYLNDFFLDESQQWFYFTGHTNAPSFPEAKIFPAVAPDSLTSLFRWQATIGDMKTYWAAIIPRSKPEFVIQGKGGGLFLYPLEVPKAPTIKARIALKKPLTSTYSNRPNLKGSFGKGVEVSTPPPARLKLLGKSEQFVWSFNSPKLATEQSGNLVVKEQGQEFESNYTLYRGYSGEFSLRMAGVLSADLQLNLLGEAAYNQWFESIFGWDNALLSHQRWGISLRHFAPLKTFKPKGSTGLPLTLRLTTFDLKYRLSPGLWERDETWGLILGVEDIVINNIHGTFGGAGFFWARSMPEIFDTIFNWFPFMSYPKWVDMEMIYYMSPLSATVANGGTPTYAVNFHGKILWTKAFFGEAGFGIKAYDYATTDETVRLSALYGTAGLGINF
jgi:hypothetical protein